ncbi:MAG: hypothetical protein JXP34_08550, partial [Planctomycetes bacterium]|nr:hypothetical protein [Planctomycetota bacterium]
RGALDLGRLLGSRRTAEDGDAAAFPSPYSIVFDDLEALYAGRTPSLVMDGDIAILRLIPTGSGGGEMRIRIDTKRNVVLEIATIDGGKTTGTTTFDDFVDVAGVVWPQRIEVRDGAGRVSQVTRIAHQAVDGDLFATDLAKALASIPEAILLELPLPKLADAKQRARDGKAAIEDRWVLLNHVAGTQQWDPAKEHLAAIETIAEGKKGLDWIRLEFLRASRRNEEARALALRIAAAIAGQPAPGDYGLAVQLYQRISERAGGHERIEFLSVLRPVFERCDERRFPLKLFDRWRLSCLDNMGRHEEVFALRKGLAEAYPDDIGLQFDYANALVRRGEVDAAVAHLDARVAENGPWTDDEIATLRERAAGILYERRRFLDFLAHADRWLATAPKRASGHFFSRTISALIMLDREAEADGLIETWLEAGRAKDLDPIAEARLEAAIGHALSEGEDLHTNRIDERWTPALVALAREFVLTERRGSVTARILNDNEFGRTDAGAALRREVYRAMAEGVETLPADVLNDLYAWTGNYGPGEGDIPRDAVLDRIAARWGKEEDPRAKAILASLILGRGGIDRALALRRKQMAAAAADDDERASIAGALFDLLLGRPWSRETEDELLALIPRIGAGEQKLAARIDAIARATDWLARTRTAKRLEEIPDRDEKPRRELKPLEEEARKRAQDDVIATLRRLEATGLGADLAPYIRIERITVEAGQRIEPARLAQELKEILLATPEPPADEDERTALDGRRAVLAERCLLVTAYLATRPDADAALAEDLLARLKDLEAKKVRLVDARGHLYRFLVALDRAADVEAALAAWAEEGGEIKGNVWRIPYAYVLAEQGKLSEAVRVFEGVEAVDELGASEHRMLAGLYMALDEKAKNRAARIRTYQVTDEWQVRASLQHDLQKYRREGDAVPEELDEDVLFRFAAVLRKSTQPRPHMEVLREYYETTKDFRLLECLPEAVIGQTAGKIYDFLRTAGDVIALIGDEATADRLEKHLAEMREKAQTDVDRRALFLLESLVEGRAADQANGAGPHADAALAALKAAFKGEWADGERVLMARYLASLRKLPEPLRAEALDQLRALHDGAEAGGEDRFAIGAERATALWANDRREEAIQVLGATIGEIREARGGLLPENAFDEFSRFTSYLRAVREFAAAEKALRAELARPYNEGRLRWLALQLFSLHAVVLAEDGETALGRGSALYRAARDEVLRALATRSDEGYANELLGALCGIFRRAHDNRIEGVGSDLADLAFRRLPEILRLYQYRNGQSMVRTVAGHMRTILGPRDAIAFLVARAETEPAWLRRAGSDFWHAHGRNVAEYRTQAGDVGDLAPRLLAIVIAEIERDLTDRRARRREMYDHHHEYFWREKADAFFRAAQKVLEARRGSEASVAYIAAYLADGLGRLDDAIDALFEFHRRDGLTEPGQWQLVQYLQRRERFEESIPLLASMVREWPGNLEYRVRQMRAFHRTGRPQDLEAARAAADAYWRDRGQFGETTAESLGSISLEVGLFEWAAKYYGEAIAARKGSRPDRGVGDGTLAGYYAAQARAYAGLGRTKEAVDAAAGAIVTWGGDEENRKRALESLLSVLRQSKDLDAYVAVFEADLSKEKLENPTIRKALGRIFIERKAYAEAARHLEAAVEGGPVDAETSRLLIEAYEKGGDAGKAAERLRSIARQAGHDYGLWKELGDRYAKLERAAEAERAYTTLAEMSANESEGRAILAGIRAARKRYADAAIEWRQVIRVRSKEPAGYLGLAEALIGSGDPAKAREVLEDVLRKTWDARFGDIHGQARKLLERIPRD